MRINNKIINSNESYFWVEEGQASVGDFNLAKKFIKTSAQIGADGIEFQLAIAEEFYIPSHPYIDHYKKIQFSNNRIIDLISYAKCKNIDFIATILSSSLIPILVEAGCSALVINASDINNPDIVDSVVESGLPFFISLPLADEKDIDWIVNRCKLKGAENFVLMQGQHTMASGEHGVSPEDSNLGFIFTLKEKYNTRIGYIDHSKNKFMPSVARAAGANFVCKHLFLDKNEKGPDWFICLPPNEMEESINHFRNINISMSKNKKVLAPGEDMDIALMRRSIMAIHEIPKGAIISKGMIGFKRPGGGIPPNDYLKIVGKRAKTTIKENEIIKLENTYEF